MKTTLLMAGAGAVTILTDRFITTVRAFVFIRSVVAGMAACAIGLIRGELPADHLGVALVAIRTQEVSTMILRFVRKRSVSIIRRCPPVSGMAHITLLRGAEVVLILANSLHAVVTGRT